MREIEGEGEREKRMRAREVEFVEGRGRVALTRQRTT
jgi:hypothetical protein